MSVRPYHTEKWIVVYTEGDVTGHDIFTTEDMAHDYANDILDNDGVSRVFVARVHWIAP